MQVMQSQKQTCKVCNFNETIHTIKKILKSGRTVEFPCCLPCRANISRELDDEAVEMDLEDAIVQRMRAQGLLPDAPPVRSYKYEPTLVEAEELKTKAAKVSKASLQAMLDALIESGKL